MIRVPSFVRSWFFFFYETIIDLLLMYLMLVKNILAIPQCGLGFCLPSTLKLCWVSFSSMVFREFIPKLGTSFPFGARSGLCPGNDLAKLEITILLHHFLLNYRFKHNNPKSLQIHLPHPRPKDNCLGKLRRAGFHRRSCCIRILLIYTFGWLLQSFGEKN